MHDNIVDSNRVVAVRPSPVQIQPEDPSLLAVLSRDHSVQMRSCECFALNLTAAF